MKYGEALQLVFEAFYKDRSEAATTYTIPSLREAIKTLPPQWKRQIMSDFRIVAHEIEKNVLSCPYPIDSVVKPYDTCEKCTKCGCVRFYEFEDTDTNSWNDRKIWSAWRV